VLVTLQQHAHARVYFSRDPSVQVWGMGAAIPLLPDDQVDEQTRAILDERLKTIDSDVKTARPWREVLAESQAKLRHQRRGEGSDRHRSCAGRD
jgi:hypothetical protein